MKIVRSALALVLLAVGLGVVAAPAGAYPAGQVARAQISSTLLAPGQSVTVTVQNTTPGSLTMQIFSAPVTIGTGTVGPDGTGSVSGVIPAGYSGAHTIQVTGAGGEVFPFPITVTSNNPGGGVNCSGLASTNPPTPQTDRHSVSFSGYTCTGSPGATVTVTLSLAPWSAALTFTIGADGTVSPGGSFTDPDHLLPLGESRVSFVYTDANGTVVAPQGSFLILVVAPSTSTPPTNTPTTPPSGSPTTTATGTATGGTGGTGSGAGTGGNLASTGAQVGLGAGLGAVALLGGGVLLLVSRRRSTPRHGA